MECEENLIEESGLRFMFDRDNCITKFDEESFYRSEYNKFPEPKGIDILADSKDVVQLIEIKNCAGHEAENMWRTSVNNSKIDFAPHDLDVEGRESLDIEVVKKVVSTIVCLYGAWTRSKRTEKAAGLLEFWKGINSQRLLNDKKKMLIVLFLEGDFVSNGPKSRSKKMMMKRIQDSINTKLSWLNCQVSVVDSDTYNERYFSVEKVR